MEWLNEKKLGIIVVVSILLVFILIVGVHFYKEFGKNVPSDKEPVVLPDDNELEFTNESSMSVETIWKLVSDKRDALKKLFFESNVYLVSEIDSTKYTKEDDEIYVVFQDSFFKTLNELVTEDVYVSLFNRVTLLKQDRSHSYYVAKKNVFDDIYVDSAIAKLEAITEMQRVVIAKEDLITATISYDSCENDITCDKKTSYPFELTKINNEWKISAFQK